MVTVDLPGTGCVAAMDAEPKGSSRDSDSRMTMYFFINRYLLMGDLGKH